MYMYTFTFSNSSSEPTFRHVLNWLLKEGSPPPLTRDYNNLNKVVKIICYVLNSSGPSSSIINK